MFSNLKSYSIITAGIFEWSMLLSRETSLITEFLKKKIFLLKTSWNPFTFDFIL